MRRVVITGLGVVSPIGSNKTDFFNGLKEGKNGVANITLFDATHFQVRFAAEVKDFDETQYYDEWENMRKIKDRKLFLGYKSIRDAIVDANLSEQDCANAGIHMGLGLETAELENIDFKTPMAEVINKQVKDPLDNSCPIDTLNNIIIKKYKLEGPAYNNTSACAASTQAIGQAFRKIRRGDIDIMFAGGFDSMVNPMAFGGFSLLGALSSQNDSPQTACKPFDGRRDGAVMGEGAATLVLEELEYAKRRGATIYGEIVGFGSSMDAYKVTDPHPEGIGAYMAMKNAVADARISLGDIAYINAHGTSTPKNDYMETLAIKNLFGDLAYKLKVSSVKSMIGHLIAAGGAVETAAAVFTLCNGIIPPTINLEVRDPYCDLDYTPKVSAKFEGEYLLKNSFGFGGQNACLVMKKY